MITETPETPDTAARPARRRTAKIGLSVVLLLFGAGLVAMTSLAVFTDTETVPANTFTTGTVDISTLPTTAVVTMPAMAPGDQVTAPLTVNNLGNLDLRYAVTSTTTEDILAAELVLRIKSGVTTCTNAGFGTDGTDLYLPAGPGGPLGTVATTTIFGSNAQGADPGDRTLAPAANETLCVNVALPLAATAGMGVTTTATFTFDAEQTINNP